MRAKIQGPEPESVTADKVEVARPLFGMDEAEFARLANSICVAIPHRKDEGLNPELAVNIGYWARMGTAVMTIPDEFGGFIEFTRAGIVRTFMEYTVDRPDVEYLVMIDNDESMDWEAPLRLAQWGKEIVSGVVPNASPKRGVYACFMVKDEFGVARFPSLKKSGKLPARGLIEAHSVGTGLLCVHRRVFETLRENKVQPFRLDESDREHCFSTGTMRMGEDTMFSRQCRDAGFKLWVDLSVRATHFKNAGIIWPPEGLDHEIDPREWKVSPLDYSHG